MTSLVCKVSLRGKSGRVVLSCDELTVVTWFKEVSGKLSSSSIKLFVSRTDTCGKRSAGLKGWFFSM